MNEAIEKNPREKANIKFLLTSLVSFFSSATFLLFLITNENFSPTLVTGEINYVNFILLLFILTTSLFFLLILLIYFFYMLFEKEVSQSEMVKKSIKFALIITLGILVVFFLHFFHIISFFWGLSIFIIALLLIFVV